MNEPLQLIIPEPEQFLLFRNAGVIDNPAAQFIAEDVKEFIGQGYPR